MCYCKHNREEFGYGHATNLGMELLAVPLLLQLDASFTCFTVTQEYIGDPIVVELERHLTVEIISYSQVQLQAYILFW